MMIMKIIEDHKAKERRKMSEKTATVEQLVSLMVEQVRYMTGGLLREHETNAQMLRQLARVWEDTASGYLAHSYAEDATWAAVSRAAADEYAAAAAVARVYAADADAEKSS